MWTGLDCARPMERPPTKAAYVTRWTKEAETKTTQIAAVTIPTRITRRLERAPATSAIPLIAIELLRRGEGRKGSVSTGGKKARVCEGLRCRAMNRPWGLCNACVAPSQWITSGGGGARCFKGMEDSLWRARSTLRSEDVGAQPCRCSEPLDCCPWLAAHPQQPNRQ